MSFQPAPSTALPGRNEEGVWVVVLAGLSLALVGAVHLALTGLTPRSTVMAFEVFIDIGLPVVAVVGLLYARRGARLPDRPIARWTCAGIVLLVLLGLWASVTELLAGEFLDALGTVVMGANLGILFGVVTGINRAQAEEQAKLVERERTQREGLAMLNHLLRHHVLNGMTIINGYTDELRDEDVPDEHVEVIERQSDRIVSLVENVRTLVESLSESVDPQPVDATEAVDRAVADARETYPEASFEVAADPVAVRADEFLRAVLDNLLSNAVQHHDGEPHVRLEVEGADPVVFRVADDGPGIPEDVRASFSETDDVGTAVAGQGLGLYLVHTIVANYGGSVTIEDNEPRGAVVTVELPRA